jgi:hypothetical protein
MTLGLVDVQKIVVLRRADCTSKGPCEVEKHDATEYRLIIPTIIVLKQASFLPNYFEEMDLKDLENAGGQVCFDLMGVII